jgi:hypothetical protein
MVYKKKPAGTISCAVQMVSTTPPGTIKAFVRMVTPKEARQFHQANAKAASRRKLKEKSAFDFAKASK